MFGDKFNFNFNNLMKDAQKIQDMMKKTEEELAKIEATGEAGAGAVKITINAKHQVKKVIIEDEIMNESKEVLCELITAAFNDATDKINKITESKMMNASKLFAQLAEDKKEEE